MENIFGVIAVNQKVRWNGRKDTWRQLRRYVWLMINISIGCGPVMAEVPRFAAGSEHSFSIDTSGHLLGWGSDRYGQLGIGRLLQSEAPRLVAIPGVIVDISSGPSHNLALLEDGSLWAWGANETGQIGDGTNADRTAPLQVGTDFTKVVAGGYITLEHNLGIKKDGSLWAWGYNATGQIGDGTRTDRSMPVQIGTGYTEIAAGGSHSLALKSDGSLWAWGNNWYGQLGDGTKTNSYNPLQVGTGYVAIAAGKDHSFAIKSNGSLWAWGNNSYGQLGDGTTTHVTAPKQIGTGFALVSTNERHTVAIKTDGSLWGWGNNLWGQLGNGTNTSSSLPIRIGTGYTMALAGGLHTTALKNDGSLWAWGDNAYGQVGDNTTTARFSPIQIGTGYRMVSIGYRNTFALKSSGIVEVWGINDHGQLGDGTVTYQSIPVSIGAGYSMVATGDRHTVALKSDGSLWAWGDNSEGQLGDGTTIDRTTPVQIDSGFSLITAGRMQSFAFKADGSLWAWGRNSSGQLGDGTTTARLTPTYIGTGYTAIAASGYHTLALKNDGGLWTWGANGLGQLGDGTTTYRVTPAKIGSGYAAIAAGGYYSIALKMDGSLWAWGQNGAGQLGDGTYTHRSTPVQIGTGFSKIVTGSSHGLALKPDGSLWAWGSNSNGQLGTGTNNGWLLVPARSGDGYYTAIAAGSAHSLALKADGSLWAMGYNASGQLGTGTLASYLAPVLISNESNNGPLDLIPEVANNIPPEKIPSFWVKTVGEGLGTGSARLSTNITLNSGDAGKTGAIVISAYVPSGTLAPSTSSMTGRYAQALQGGNVVSSPATAASSGCALVYLTPSGWQASTNGQVIPYTTGVLNDQMASQTILNGTDTTNFKGNDFCIGYSVGNALPAIRAVATIPDDNNVGTCKSSCEGPLKNLPAGWNLLGNGFIVPLDVTTYFADSAKVTTVWKWNGGRWAFYTPSLSDKGAAYASAKGYDLLTTIDGGEGFWVNAGQEHRVQLPAGAPVTSNSLTTLPSGWNLKATADNKRASEFSSALGGNLTTLWAWDDAMLKWYFYAPSLVVLGGTALTDYITSKGYLDFEALNRNLLPGTGFWVNRP